MNIFIKVIIGININNVIKIIQTIKLLKNVIVVSISICIFLTFGCYNSC